MNWVGQIASAFRCHRLRYYSRKASSQHGHSHGHWSVGQVPWTIRQSLIGCVRISWVVISIVMFASSAAYTEDSPAQEQGPSKSVAWLSDPATAYRDALSRQRPILVRAGGESCPWCKQLEAEIDKPAVQNELRDWTLLYVDVEKEASELKHLGIGPIPALRALSSRGRLVKSQDGFLDADALVKWLREAHSAATEAPDPSLLGNGQPTLIDVMRLIRQLENRDAATREAAIQRLIPFPTIAGKAVAKAFRDRGLATKLATFEILQQWQAPVADLDPWRPETYSQPRLAVLDQWLTDLDPESAAPTALTEHDMQSVRRDIQRMLDVDGAEIVAVRERIARLGEAVVPDVLKLLAEATADRDRERLLALRYRLAATSSLVLSWPGGLQRLADRDPRQRHQAAQELASIATEDLQPLLLELFSDPDPLVRELSLQGLRHVGGKRATAALVKLLADPEPNVRAAVLKQLSEDASKEMVNEISAYVKQETDADLVVHAVRYFRAVKDEKAIPSLLALLEHSSWQVRAEAAEAVAETVESMRYRLSSGKPRDMPDVHGALLKLLGDSDAFVLSRALEGLKNVDADRAVEPLVQAAERHPTLAKQIVGILAKGKRMREKVIPHLRTFFTSQDPELRAGAIAGLCQTHSERLRDELPTALADSDTAVRTAAAQALLAMLVEKHPLKGENRSTAYSMGSSYGQEIFIEGSSAASPSLAGRLLRSAFGSLFPSPSRNSGEQIKEEDAESPKKTRDPFDESDVDQAATKKPSAPVAAPVTKKPMEEDERAASEAARAVDGKSEEAEEGGTDESSSSSALDTWLAESYAGKHREAWNNELAGPLQGMLQAESLAERQAAALALLPFGKLSEALPVIVTTAREEADLFERAPSALGWVPRSGRNALFWDLVDAARDDSELVLLAHALREFKDPSTIDLFWKLLQREDVSNDFIQAIDYGLRKAYFQDQMHETSAIRPIRRSRLLTDIEPHCKDGTAAERLVATALLQQLADDKAIQFAQLLTDDQSLPEPMRLDGLQLLLAAHESRNRPEIAVATLADSQAGRRKVALKYLALGDDSLNTLDNTGIDTGTGGFTSFSIGSSGKTKMIIPEPPRGLAPDQVRPLLADTDPEIAAYAGYLLALFGKEEGLAPLLRHWRTQEGSDELERLVYRAIASLDNPQHIPVLREIYAHFETSYETRDFYWTIRIMSGPEILQFRKRIRDEVGMSNLD